MMKDYYSMCRYVFPNKTNKNEFKTEHVYDADVIIDAGEMTTVPHHISTLPEILSLINNTVSLFKQINSRPEIITVATSRKDQYTPEQQASQINTLVLSMLKKQWPNSKITRYDIPEYSTDEYIPIDTNMNTNNDKKMMRSFY